MSDYITRERNLTLLTDYYEYTKRKRRLWASFSFGEPSGIRTPGPLIKSQMLCRLS